MKAAGARDLARSSVLAKYPKVTEEFGMLAGKRVHKEIILAMVTAVLLLAATARTARAEGTCTSGTCYGVQYINYFTNATPSNPSVYARVIDPLEANGTQPEEICSMVYVFDEFEALQECCGCPITSDGLLTLSIGGPNPANNLTSNPDNVQGQFFFTLNGYTALQDGVIRLLSTTTNASTTPQSSYNLRAQGTAESLKPGVYCDRYSGKCCDPTGGATGPGTGSLTLITTLRAWADHIQNAPGAVTNSEFEEAPIAASDATNLAELCFRTITSGVGFCNCGNEFILGNDSGGNQGTGGDGTI